MSSFANEIAKTAFVKGYKEGYLLSYVYSYRKCRETMFRYPKLTEDDLLYIANVLDESFEDTERNYGEFNRLFLSVVRDYEIGITDESMIEWDEKNIQELVKQHC